MDCFTYRDGRLYCEQIPVARLAQRWDTPLYVYSAGTLIEHLRRLARAFAALHPTICFSLKSCPNLHIARLLRTHGAGFDVVSGGELYRARLAGATPESIVFAGVGKTDREIREALAAQIGLFNVESASELERLAQLAAEAGCRADAALRINPDVDARTHHHTTTGTSATKFGVDWRLAGELFERARDWPALNLRGLHLHIGSPVNDVAVYRAAVVRAVELVEQLRAGGFAVDTLDIGGGYGAYYSGDEAPSAEEYAGQVVPLLEPRGLRVILEPGRSIAANAGVLLTRVLHVKEGARRFVIVDASMNELIRPALYGAYHFVWPVEAGSFSTDSRGAAQPFAGLQSCDVVGPVCESADFLARQRPLPPLQRGDLLAVFTVGAYGMAMASQYNSRPRAAEVLVEGHGARLIRRGETYADLVASEQLDESPLLCQAHEE